MIVVRKATIADASPITGFQMNMAWETEKISLDPETVNKGVNSVFSDSRKGEYYVAEAEGKVIASLLITCEWSDWRNSNIWWFQSVYVIPEYRRQGVFRKMYTFIKNKAMETGIAGLRLYVETGNEQAMKTYESLGMNSGHYLLYEWMRK